jgi:hypothetical protein
MAKAPAKKPAKKAKPDWIPPWDKAGKAKAAAKKKK